LTSTSCLLTARFWCCILDHLGYLLTPMPASLVSLQVAKRLFDIDIVPADGCMLMLQSQNHHSPGPTPYSGVCMPALPLQVAKCLFDIDIVPADGEVPVLQSQNQHSHGPTPYSGVCMPAVSTAGCQAPV
jgi:hypothetical protein